jgi:hypothetical protein
LETTGSPAEANPHFTRALLVIFDLKAIL